MVLGFAMFAIDETDKGSKAQQAKLERELGTTHDPIAPSADQEAARERTHGKVRETIDDANDVLLRPFAGLTESADSRWVRRGIPALLGLLVYGFLLAYFARYSKGHG